MQELFKIASRITSPWSLAAFGIAAVLYIVLKKRGKIPTLGWLCIFAFVVSPILASTYLEAFRIRANDASLYRLRITVIGPDEMPVEDARVWSSIGGEPKKVPAGWEFDISSAVRPSDGRLTVFAAASSDLLARSDITLGDDHNPAVVVQLQKRASTSIRGVVIDDSGSGIEGVIVSAVGFETDTTTTGTRGQFVLPTHHSEGEQVLLKAEKQGYTQATQYHPAGVEPVSIILSRK